MKNMKKYLALALSTIVIGGAFSGCSSSGSSSSFDEIKKKGTLMVATNADFPPFEYIDGNKVVGIDMDIVQELGKRLGVEVAIEHMDFDAIIPGVQVGKFDMGVAGITINEKRKKNADFSDPYFLATQVIVVEPGSDIKGKDDLKDKTIAVQTGTTAEDYCMNNGYKVLSFAANTDAMSAVTSKKADAFVVDNEVAVAMAKNNNMVVLDEPMTSESYAFVFAKGNESLVKAVNEQLAVMLEDGTIEKIFNNYETIYVSPLEK